MLNHILDICNVSSTVPRALVPNTNMHDIVFKMIEVRIYIIIKGPRNMVYNGYK